MKAESKDSGNKCPMRTSEHLDPAVPEGEIYRYMANRSFFFSFFSLMPVSIKYILSDLERISENWPVPIPLVK